MSEERTLVKRSDKKAFWGVGGADAEVFSRMRGFTELSGSKNPVEYSRRYIDEQFETTSVTGYSPSWSFGFDDYVGDVVLEDIVNILDDEAIGTDAEREMVFVDFARPTEDGSYPAVKRKFAVIGDSEGDGTDAYTYGGNFKVAGDAVKGTVTITNPAGGNPDNVSEVTFTEAE